MLDHLRWMPDQVFEETVLPVIVLLQEEVERLRESNAESMEIVKAVAHIGLDWGYGPFELSDEHIADARRIYEAAEAIDSLSGGDA